MLHKLRCVAERDIILPKSSGLGRAFNTADEIMSFKYDPPEIRRSLERRRKRIQAFLNNGLSTGAINQNDVERYHALMDESRRKFSDDDESGAFNAVDEAGKILKKCDPDGSLHEQLFKEEHREMEQEADEHRREVEELAELEGLDYQTAYLLYRVRELESDMSEQKVIPADPEELAELIEEYELLPFFIEGRDPSDYMTMIPVKVHEPIKDEIKDVQGMESHCFSFREPHFYTFLQDIFVDAFDEKLPVNQQRYTSYEHQEADYAKSFDTYAINNFYRASEIRDIVAQVEQLGNVFEQGQISSLPQKLMLRLKAYELEHSGRLFIEDEKEYREAVAKFYHLLSKRLEKMLSECPDADYYSLEGL